jgi:hypothetical protein
MFRHFARSIGAAASMLQLAIPFTNLAAVQGFHRQPTAANTYQITSVHDRLTDSSDVAATLTRRSRPFGLGSVAWLDLSFSHAGLRLTTPPPSVRLTIESWAPGRGGWAFAHPRSLHIESGDSIRLDLLPAGYAKRRVHLLDAGRREALWYDVPARELIRLAGAPELVFRAGNARLRVLEGMEMFREVARRITPSVGGPQ